MMRTEERMQTNIRSQLTEMRVNGRGSIGMSCTWLRPQGGKREKGVWRNDKGSNYSICTCIYMYL